MTWKPSPEPGRYDRQRVVQLQPVKDVVSRLDLPLLRRRKITGILTALEMQIEDGGDAPDVNALLLDALPAVLRHQVAGAQLTVALQALDAWERAERTYWEQMCAGTRPPVEPTLDVRLDDLMQEGYQLLAAQQRTAACDRWLEAWDLVKQLARSEMRTATAFDQAHPLFQSGFNRCQDLELEAPRPGNLDATPPAGAAAAGSINSAIWTPTDTRHDPVGPWAHGSSCSTERVSAAPPTPGRPDRRPLALLRAHARCGDVPGRVRGMVRA